MRDIPLWYINSRKEIKNKYILSDSFCFLIAVQNIK